VEEPIQLVSWLAMDDCKMHSRTVEYIVRDDIEFKKKLIWGRLRIGNEGYCLSLGYIDVKFTLMFTE